MSKLVTLSIPTREQRKLARLARAAEGEVKRQVRALIAKYAYKIEASAKANLDREGLPGVDTGAARAATGVELDSIADKLAADILTRVFYALYIHEGTGVHAAKGDGRKTPWVYYDEKLGRYVFTKGMLPNPYLTDAYNEHINDFIRDLKRLFS